MSALGLPTTSPGAVFEIDSAGTIDTLLSVPVGGPNTITVAGDNRSLLVGSLFGSAVVEIDPKARSVVRTVNAGSLTSITWITPSDSGAIVVAGFDGPKPGVFRLDPLSGATATLYVGNPFAFPNTVVHDLVTGDYIVGDSAAQALFRVANDGTLVTTWPVGGVGPVSMAQDPTDGRLVIGSSAAQVFTFQPRSGTLLRFGAVLNPNAVAIDRAGQAPVVCGAFGPIVRFDRQGLTSTTLSTMPPGFVGTGMCFAGERNIVTSRAGSQAAWQFDLDFAGDAGRPYVFALSFSGFTPGIDIDARRLALNFDVLVAVSVSGSLGPILSGTSGVLDPAGRATAVLDLRGVPGPIPRIPVWACAVTLDPSAPSGVGTIAKPVVIVL